ncbi:hypothetical protein QTP86_003742 [Hemibagrus guttatus]|nr:hypothetical protein QTP86_003742 [Hemibagrus guttatus]
MFTTISSFILLSRPVVVVLVIAELSVVEKQLSIEHASTRLSWNLDEAEKPRHATPRHATPRHATPRHATPRHATPRHATPRHATPPYGSYRLCGAMDSVLDFMASLSVRPFKGCGFESHQSRLVCSVWISTWIRININSSLQQLISTTSHLYNNSSLQHLISTTSHLYNNSSLQQLISTTSHLYNNSSLQHLIFTTSHLYNNSSLQHLISTTTHLYNNSSLQHLISTTSHLYNISSLQQLISTTTHLYNISSLQQLISTTSHLYNNSSLQHLISTTTHLYNISSLQHLISTTSHLYNNSSLQQLISTTSHLYNNSSLQHLISTTTHLYNISSLQHLISTTTHLYNSSLQTATTDEELQTVMAFRGFLQELKSWTLGEIACAAGLVAFTAGAGYCVYRSLRGERAPPEHTQPPHEPVDLLGESSDTPSVLQVVEPILPLLPTETHPTSSAVVLPLSAGELNSTCCNVEYNTADSSLSQSEPVDIRRDILRMVRGPESRLCWLETAETHRLTLEGFPFQNNYEDSFPGIQVVDPNPQLLPIEHHQESSPILLEAVMFIMLFISQTLDAVDVKGYFLGMIRGPESRFCWFKTTKTHNFNHLGFPYQTTIEDCFTAIQVRDFLHVARDGWVNISTWEQEQVHFPHSDSEEQYDSELSKELHQVQYTNAYEMLCLGPSDITS